jgi:hypothetical protein
METESSPKLSIKVSPSHQRIAEALAEQVQKEYQEFLMRERAGTLTPRPTETCCQCKNEFVKSEMIFVENRDLWSGVEVKGHHYCTEDCEKKGELAMMRKAEEEDERRRLFKFRPAPGRWLASVFNSMILNR